MITFQICSVLSGKLNSPAHLQENKCTSYCLLESASWAVCFFSFQWACCDFVLTDWAVFHFAFIFHPVRRIFSAFFFPFPSLWLSVWISALKQRFPLLCIAALQLLVPQRPELNLPHGELRSSLGHLSGQHLLPWAGCAGEVVGWVSLNVWKFSWFFFTWLVLCFPAPTWGAVPWAGSPPVLGVSCAHSCRENLGQLLLPAAQGGLLKVFARV